MIQTCVIIILAYFISFQPKKSANNFTKFHDFTFFSNSMTSLCMELFYDLTCFSELVGTLTLRKNMF